MHPHKPFDIRLIHPFLAMYQYNNNGNCSYNRIIIYTMCSFILCVSFFLIQRLTLLSLLPATMQLLLTLHYVLPFALCTSRKRRQL